MNITERKDGKMYWYVHISYSNNEYLLNLKKDHKNVILNKFMIP